MRTTAHGRPATSTRRSRRAAKTLTATYTVDYQMHGPIGPTVRDRRRDARTARVVITNTQGVYRLARQLSAARCSACDAKKIRVAVLRGLERLRPLRATTTPRCAAAIMSQALGGTPVRVQFMRWDDHGWDNYGPAHLSDVRAGIDASGNDRRDTTTRST